MRSKSTQHLFWSLICLFLNSFCVPSVMPLEVRLICARIPGLTQRQRKVCLQTPQSMAVISYGLKIAANECQRQFSDKRWNCTLKSGSNLFSHTMRRGSREAAYFHSIRSAGAAYAISEACSRGNVTFCGCDHTSDASEWSDHTWKWSGCGTDINYGIKLSKKFIDTYDRERRLRSLMDSHNNNAGRKLLKDLLVSQCKCHGVSGSCSSRTCWKALPSFTNIGDTLMDRYVMARRVRLHSKCLRMISSMGRSMDSMPEPKELVYFDNSVNYCDDSPLNDSLGTGGRQCNKSSADSDGCASLCCGRGYNTEETIEKWHCVCRFRFCCAVDCHQCSRLTELYVCK